MIIGVTKENQKLMRMLKEAKSRNFCFTWRADDVIDFMLQAMFSVFKDRRFPNVLEKQCFRTSLHQYR